MACPAPSRVSVPPVCPPPASVGAALVPGGRRSAAVPVCVHPGSLAYISCFAGRWMREQPAVLLGLELVPGESDQVQGGYARPCGTSVSMAQTVLGQQLCIPGCRYKWFLPLPGAPPSAGGSAAGVPGQWSFFLTSQARRPPCRCIPDGTLWPEYQATNSFKAVSGDVGAEAV